MDPVGATVKLNGINHFETTDSGGCSVTDLLCRPCHFLGLSTGTSMCCERGHELRLWTPTHSWETQKMSRENTESKNLLFCKEQRRYMPGSNEEGARNTFALMWQSDLWTRREAIPLLWIHSFGLFWQLKKVGIIILLEKWAHWVSGMLRVAPKVTQLAGGCDSSWVRSVCPASMWVFPQQFLPSRPSVSSTRIPNSQATSQVGQNLHKVLQLRLHKSAVVFKKYLLSLRYSLKDMPWMNTSAFSRREYSLNL